MAKINVPNSQLYNWNLEIRQNQHSIIMFLLVGRIETFLQNNGAKIQAINEGILKIQKKYLHLSDDNKLMYEEDGKTLKLKPFQRADQYYEELDQFMGQMTTVISN